jgi:hypothetical protein
MSIRGRLETMIRELEEHPELKLTQANLGPPATEMELETARLNVADAPPGEWVDELEMYVQLDEDAPFSEIWDPSMELFYREVGSLELEWEALPSNRYSSEVYGSIHIPRIEEVFPDSFSELLLADSLFSDAGEALYERARQLHLLDRFQPEACAFLDLSDGAFSVCYFSISELPEESVMPTGLNFSQWLECLLNSRGFGYWLTSCTLEKQQSRAAQRFLETAPQLFPDFRASLFVPQTEIRSVFEGLEYD